jgi:hypothetical protein
MTVQGSLEALDVFEQAVGPGEAVSEQDDSETIELFAEGEWLRQCGLRELDTMRRFHAVDTKDLKEVLVAAGVTGGDVGGGPPVT